MTNADTCVRLVGAPRERCICTLYIQNPYPDSPEYLPGNPLHQREYGVLPCDILVPTGKGRKRRSVWNICHMCGIVDRNKRAPLYLSSHQGHLALGCAWNHVVHSSPRCCLEGEEAVRFHIAYRDLVPLQPLDSPPSLPSWGQGLASFY